MTLIELFTAGIFGGFFLGMIGVGMALVTVPVLTFALPGLDMPPDLAPTAALATSMRIVAIASIRSVTADSP